MLAQLEAHSRALLGIEDEAESSAMAQRRASVSDEDEESGEEMSDDGWGAGDGMVSDSEDEFATGVAAKGELFIRYGLNELIIQYKKPYLAEYPKLFSRRRHQGVRLSYQSLNEELSL